MSPAIHLNEATDRSEVGPADQADAEQLASQPGGAPGGKTREGG